MEPLRPSDPQTVGRYQILGRLGAGGMGVVYLADGPRGRVALKLVRPELSDDTQFRTRFRREVQSSFRVSSDHTARLIDFDTEAEQAWMATEYVEGRPLDDEIGATGPFDAGRQLEFTAKLAEALAAIHAQDVIHRDIKPSNVLCTPFGPKLIDFGIAAAADAARITSTGLMVGSPGWLAPEQIATGEATPASDVFALGLVLAYAATGQPPYGVGPTEVLFYRTLNEPPTLDLQRIAPALQEVIRLATARTATDRPSAADLVQLLGAGGVAWTPPPQALAGTYGTTIEPVHTDGIGRTAAGTLAPPAVPRPTTPPPFSPPPSSPPLVGPPPLPGQRGNGMPTQPPAPTPPPQRSRRGLYIGGAVVAVGAVIGGIVLLAGGSSSPAPKPQPTRVDTVARRTVLTNAALVNSSDWSGPLGPVTMSVVQGPCPQSNLSPPVNIPERSVRSTDHSFNYLQESVVAFDNPAEATDFASRASTAWRACTPFNDTNADGSPEHVTLSLPSSIAVGDDSVYRTTTYMQSAQPNYTALWMLMRKGSVVVAITGYTEDDSTAVDQFRSLLDKSAQRIAAVG